MSKLKTFHTNVIKEFKKVGIDCELNIIKESTITNPLFINCICVFRMPDPYKDETIYINGLNLMLDNFQKVAPNSILRIYYDDSVIKKDNKWNFLIKKAKDKAFTEIIHYDFKQFKKPNSFYHEGIFGMMVRLFPLFNFSKIDEIITIDDIDYEKLESFNERYNMIKNSIKYIKNTKSTFIYGTYGYKAYINSPRLMISSISNKYNFSIRMYSHPSICSKKLDKKILIDFMLCILNKCDIYNKWISELINNLNCDNNKLSIKKRQQCQQYKEMKKLKFGSFLYGLDEYFLNEPVLEYFLKNKKPFIIYYALPSLVKYHFVIYKMFTEKKISLEFISNMYLYILNKKVNTIEDVNNSFTMVDKEIYSIDNTQDITIDKAEIILKKMYDYLHKNVDYLLKLKNLQLFENQMFIYLKNLDYSLFYKGYKLYEIMYKPNLEYNLILVN